MHKEVEFWQASVSVDAHGQRLAEADYHEAVLWILTKRNPIGSCCCHDDFIRNVPVLSTHANAAIFS